MPEEIQANGTQRLRTLLPASARRPPSSEAEQIPEERSSMSVACNALPQRKTKGTESVGAGNLHCWRQLDVLVCICDCVV
jgi:hypothetical protein